MLTVDTLIAVLSLCLTSFDFGYAIGFNGSKTTKKYSTKLSFQNFVSKTCGFEHKKADTHIFHVELCQKLPKSCKIITRINKKQYTSAKCT